MHTKYSYLTDLELVRSVRYDHGDLVEELCERLELLVEENARMEKENEKLADEIVWLKAAIEDAK